MAIQRRPLSGVRILDLTQTLAGPFGSMILGDLGAEVIKIENPNAPDVARSTPPHFIRGESTYFFSLNRNKKSLALDLKTADGKKVFHDLAGRSDVVLQNFRPGTMEKLGIGYRRLRRINPRLVFCSLTGYGLTGPWKRKPGYDYVIQAFSGFMHLTGEPGGPPMKAGLSIVDHVGGLYAVIGILAALELRRRTGRGTLVDLALLDGQMSLFTYLASACLNAGEKPKRTEDSAHAYIVPVQNFLATDGTLVVMAMNDRFWLKLCRAIGRPDWAEDPRYRTLQLRYRNRRSLLPALKRIFQTRTVAEWTRRLEKADVVCGPVGRLEDALAHPQVRGRGMVIRMRHPKAGFIELLGNPIKLAASTAPLSAPPLLGQHSRWVLRSVAGYPESRIRLLKRAGVIR